MKIAIAGSTGYIGSRLAEYFVQKGYHVHAGVRRLEQFFEPSNKKTCFLVDYTSESSLAHFVKECDIVIFALGVNSEFCSNNLERAKLIKVDYAAKLFNVANKQLCKKFFYLSSCHVYSPVCAGYFDENSPVNNNHPYAVVNLLAEQKLKSLVKPCGTSLLILRLSNVFGYTLSENKGEDLFINNLVRDAVRKCKVEIRNSPCIMRNFVPMSLVIEIINAIILGTDKKFLSIKHSSSGIYNLGYFKSFKLHQAAKLIKSYVDIIKNSDTIVKYKGNTSLIKKEKYSYTSKYIHQCHHTSRSYFKNELIKLISCF